MACVQFKSIAFRQESLALINHCSAIIDDYLGQGLRLTLRQLYYQLVTKNLLENKERSYKNLGNLVSDARLAGMLDWDAIEDRVRVPRSPSEFTGLRELADAALATYRLPRWADQEAYVELWVEKDALAGVLEPLASENHVTLMVNRGYSSQSAMYEAGARFQEHPGKKLILFYLGDHDPSGEDMVRDIRVRLDLFGAPVDVQKIALTMAQIEHYRPPPNPAKMSDSRAAGTSRSTADLHGRSTPCRPRCSPASCAPPSLRSSSRRRCARSSLVRDATRSGSGPRSRNSNDGPGQGGRLMKGGFCRCGCGYRCGGPGVCKLKPLECLQQAEGHFVRDCDHDFTGPTWTSDDGCMSSVTCAKCGLTAIGHDMRVGP